MNPDPENRVPPHILIVDDDPDICLSLTDLLGGEGYQVVAVPTGAEAIAKVREERFEVVVLDLGLPDLDGLHVLRVLKELAPTLPVVILSASSNQEKINESLGLGAFAYLTKPYNLENCQFYWGFETWDGMKTCIVSHNSIICDRTVWLAQSTADR